MTGNERLLKKMSIGDILDYSIELYKRNFKKLFMLALILYIPFILVYTGVISYLTGDLFKAAGIDFISETMEESADLSYKFLAYMVVVILMALLYMAFSITLQPVLDGAITHIIYNDAVKGKSIDWRDAIKNSFKKFGKLFLNRLLFGLILYGIISAAAIAFYLVFFVGILFMFTTTILTSSSGSNVGGILLVIGLVLISLLAFLGFAVFIGYFAMRFGLGTQSVIVENTTASTAISRSHVLTSKKFWHSGLAVGTALLMTSLLPTILASGAYLLVFIDKGLYALANSASQIIAAILQPFLTVVMTMVFIDLKIRKEGLDLEVRVDAMLEEEKKRAEVLQGGDTVNA